MGCCTGFARLLLIFFNFIFWLSGVALLGIGIWILVDPEIEQYQKVMEDASAEGDFLQTAAYILIGFGVFVLLVGFSGCCGAIRKSKCLLGMYIFFLVIVFAGELAAVVYVAINKGDVEDDLGKGLKTSISEHYGEGLEKAWDKVQEELKCCGGMGPSDYANSTWAVDKAPKMIPTSCCTSSDTQEVTDCQSMTNHYYKKGCKSALSDWINDNGYIIIGVGAGIAALQIIVLICAVCFCRHMNDEDKPY